MDYSNTIRFVLKGTEFVVHKDVVKDLPIFQELNKSDKVETIVYDAEISKGNINLVLDLLYCRKDYVDSIKDDKYTVKEVYRKWSFKRNIHDLEIKDIAQIYAFMTFLEIDNFTIDCVTKEYLEYKNMKNLVDYGIANNMDIQYFEMINKYVVFSGQVTEEFIKEINTTDEIKDVLFLITQKQKYPVFRDL